MKGKGTGPRRGASQYKTLHAQGELMSRFLKHCSTWNILFNIYDVPIQTGPLRCKF